jgi:hypothetical protein
LLSVTTPSTAGRKENDMKETTINTNLEKKLSPYLIYYHKPERIPMEQILAKLTESEKAELHKLGIRRMFRELLENDRYPTD